MKPAESPYGNTKQVGEEILRDAARAHRLRAIALERFNLSLGSGLGRFKGRAFRIGHLGDFNELMLAGTLCGVEMALTLAGVPFARGGVDAALAQLLTADAVATQP